MAEKKVEEKKKLGTEDWEAERTRLSEEVKKAQQELWDHTHPVIEDPQVKAQAEYRAQQAEETKKSTKSGKFVTPPSGKGGLGFTPDDKK